MKRTHCILNVKIAIVLLLSFLAVSCRKDECKDIKEEYNHLKDTEQNAAQKVRNSIKAIQATIANNMWSGNFTTMMNVYVTNNNITRPLNISDTSTVAGQCSEGMLTVTGLPPECVEPLNNNIEACSLYNTILKNNEEYYENNKSCIEK